MLVAKICISDASNYITDCNIFFLQNHIQIKKWRTSYNIYSGCIDCCIDFYIEDEAALLELANKLKAKLGNHLQLCEYKKYKTPWYKLLFS